MAAVMCHKTCVMLTFNHHCCTTNILSGSPEISFLVLLNKLDMSEYFRLV